MIFMNAAWEMCKYMPIQTRTQLNLYPHEGAYLNIRARFMKNASFIRTEKVKIMELTVFRGK